ncbi:hypothetical protein [Tropicibacter oceani]|uniref:Dihydroorotate dehydrogenase n=1 Tax=Tropicibacter oceani TaxID=3058420 RepID=A0ABY8QNS2_9RHOB|nr:hypothetical protein [Tropicibacter oceani]WGW05598.1 hypothetical protein QF118_08630 [Tropicibacter oceani]
MTERKHDKPMTGPDLGLDAYFDAARADTPLPSGDFMARIEAQALAAMPAPVPAARTARGPGLFAQLKQALGGWPAMAGLAAACAAGLWLGISPPAGVSSFIGTDAAELDTLGVDPLSGFDLAMMEG